MCQRMSIETLPPIWLAGFNRTIIVICNLLEVCPKFPREPDFLAQEGSPRPGWGGWRLWVSLSQLAELWRVPAKVWDSVTETAVGLLHSQTMLSVFVLCARYWGSSAASQQLRELPVTGEKECVCDRTWPLSIFYVGVRMCTCPCRSGCPGQA